MSKIHPSSNKKKMETEQIKIEKFQYLDEKDNNENKIFKNTFSGFPIHLFQCKKDKQDKILIILSEGKLAKKFGLNTNQDKGKYLKDFFPKKKDYNTIKPYYDKAFNGEEVKYEIKLNNNTWVKTVIQPFKKNSDGDTTEIIGYSEEITDRKNAEIELTKKMNKLNFEREQLLSIFDSINQAIYIVDPKTYEILYANPFLKKAFSKELKGSICYKSLQGKDSPCDFCTNKIIFNNKNKVYRWEHYNTVTNRYYDLTDRTILWPDGREVRFELAIDITDIKKTQEKLKNLSEELEIKVKERTEEVEKSNQNLENIIDSAYEIIISFDERNKILTWGKRIEQLTGFKRNKIVGKNIKETQLFDNAEELLENIEKIRQDNAPDSNIVVLNTKSGSKRVLKTSFSSIKKNDNYGGVILIGEDITLQIESHGRFINGYSYYSLGWKQESIFNLFKNIVESYCDKGLYITRPNQDLINSTILSKKIEIMLLKQKNLDEIVNKIKNFVEKNKKSVIFLDRVDYLISNFTFNQFIKYLYIITDIISENNSTFILSCKPSFFDEKQVSLIKSELLPIPGQHLEEIQIKDDYYEILELVNKYNKNNVLVEFKKISDELSINRKTLSKKISYLEKQGLIIVKNYGRSKTPYLTEKSKAILNKNL